MQRRGRWRLRWIDHYGFWRSVVEQDHQVREQTGAASCIDDSPAATQSPDAPRDFPCLVQLFARQTAGVTEDPTHASEQAVPGKTIKVVFGEPVA